MILNKMNEQLHKLQEQIVRKEHLQSMLRDLNAQKQSLEIKVEELDALRQREDLDVQKLEGRSLAVFFYNVVGKLDEKLTKERQEAYEAAVKYDAAVKELKTVEQERKKLEAEWCAFGNCEQEYQQIFEEKEKLIKASGTSEGEEIFKLEEQIVALEMQKREISEAITAGSRAHSTASMILRELDDAEGWGTWDLLGGGLLSDAMKYSHLDEAQKEIEQLQMEIRQFRTELADVTIYADVQVNIDGVMRFADYFFDCLFTDWAVLDQIKESREQIIQTKDQIRTVIEKLNSMEENVENNITQLKIQKNNLIIDAGK